MKSEYHNDGNSIIGVFRTRRDAERAIDALLNAGFSDNQLGVLLRGMNEREELSRERELKEPHLAESGSKGVPGRGSDIIAKLDLLAVSGLGPVFARGAFESTLTGVAAEGILRGLLVGLVGIGIPEAQAGRYEERVKDGDILVTVFCDTQCGRARSVMMSYAASDVSHFVGRRLSGEESPRGEEYR